MKTKIKGRVISIVIIGICILLFQTIDLAGAKDPDYPTKPITLYIGLGAGGVTDLIARGFGATAAKYLGQSFIYINKGGAGGTLAATAIMNAKPDGYTLGTTAPSAVFVAPFSGEASYKDLSGFTMIVNYGNFVYGWTVRSDAPWKTWKEFIEWAKKNPRAAKIGATGAKSTCSAGFALVQIEKIEQVEFAFIPFPGGGDVLSAILGGHITMSTGSLSASTMPYIQGGKLRILTYQGTQKAAGYDEIPTLGELYDMTPPPDLMGIWGPKGLPEYVLKKLDDAFAKTVKDTDFVNFMKRMHTPIVYMNRNQMNKYVEENYQKAGEVIKMMMAEEAKKKK